MTIHLPAILMFTRGTRFWHTAILAFSKPRDRHIGLVSLKDISIGIQYTGICPENSSIDFQMIAETMSV